MPRAHRHYLPGYVWHITHRCHRKQFLLKFVRDRQRWTEWLYEARKRFKLSVLNYMVTSNHIHLLVWDKEGDDVLPISLQLIEGRTGQEYNLRKHRNGAFWEDRYHATAIECDQHLLRCMVYIDLNMVRAGVVKDPGEWKFCAYHEIQSSRKRYRIVDTTAIQEMFQMNSLSELQVWSRNRVEDSLLHSKQCRESLWTESVAVGSEKFVKEAQSRLGLRGQGRRIIKEGDSYMLRESTVPYNSDFDLEKAVLSSENTYFWD